MSNLFTYRDFEYVLKDGVADDMQNDVELMLGMLLEAEGDEVGPSGETFCGCEVCIVREVMTLMIPLTIDHYRAKRITVRRRKDA